MDPQLSRRSVLAATTAGSLTALTARVTASTQSQSGWPYANHDPANTNHAPNATGPRENVETASVVSVDSTPTKGVIVANGTLYLGYGQTIGAYSVDGTEQWTWTADEGRAGTPVAYADQLLFVNTGGENSVVRFIETETAAQRLRASAGQDATITPFGERVYVSGTEGLVALGRSGSGQWQQPLDQPAIGTAVTDDRVIVTTEGSAVAINRASGEIQWRQSVQPRHAPVVADGRVYVAGETLVAFDESGTERWRASELPATTTVPAVTADTVYVGAGGDDAAETFFAVNAADGTIDWGVRLGSTAVPTASPATTRPAATGETVYVGSNQTMHGIDAASGEIQWRETVEGTVGHPVPVGGQLLFTTGESQRLLSVTDGDPGGSTGSGTNNGSGEDGTQGQGETDEQDPTRDSQQNSDDSQSSDGSGPGFGLPAGLAALGGASYILRSRDFGEDMQEGQQQDDGNQ